MARFTERKKKLLKFSPNLFSAPVALFHLIIASEDMIKFSFVLTTLQTIFSKKTSFRIVHLLS